MDLSQAPGSLTEAEKDAIAWSFAGQHGVEALTLTQEELAEEGYLTEVDTGAEYKVYQWEEGVLFSITPVEEALDLTQSSQLRRIGLQHTVKENLQHHAVLQDRTVRQPAVQIHGHTAAQGNRVHFSPVFSGQKQGLRSAALVMILALTGCQALGDKAEAVPGSDSGEVVASGGSGSRAEGTTDSGSEAEGTAGDGSGGVGKGESIPGSEEGTTVKLRLVEGGGSESLLLAGKKHSEYPCSALNPHPRDH